MIEREFIKEKTKYLKAKEHIHKAVGKTAGIGRITIDKTPLGEKIIVEAVKPGLVIGRGGQTISKLTLNLKKGFKLENPQIEVREIAVPAKFAGVIAKRIAANLERFGPARFKAVGYRALHEIMNAGALGTEIRITGRGVPSARSRSWSFVKGYMKKSGQISLEYIDTAVERANLRSGTVGIKVRIMHPDIPLPDKITIKEKIEKKEDKAAAEKEQVAKVPTEQTPKEKSSAKKAKPKKAKPKKKVAKKKAKKEVSEAPKEEAKK